MSCSHGYSEQHAGQLLGSGGPPSSQTERALALREVGTNRPGDPLSWGWLALSRASLRQGSARF